MSEGHFLVLLGTIWIAPHANKWYGMPVGGIMLIVAVCKGLGLI